MAETSINRFIDQLVSITLYSGLIVIVLWGGAKLINYALDFRLYDTFLANWKRSVTAAADQPVNWPVYSGQGGLQEYMDEVALEMSMTSSGLPESNTDKAYIYLHRKFGKARQQVFVTAFEKRLVIYGLSEQTLLHLDNFIDEREDLTSGSLTGSPATDKTTYIGTWEL